MPSLTRREVLGRGSAIAGGLTLGQLGMSRFAFAQDLTKATFQLGWIANVENMGEFMAAERGYYTAEGLDLTIEPGGPAVAAEPIVIGGKALLGLSQADNVARARAEGGKLKVIGATFQRNPAAVMSLAGKPITTPQELVGKKLGMQQSGVAMYDSFFTSLGIDPKSITYVPVQFDPAPLVTGEVDAFCSFQTNQPIQLALQGVETKTFLLADFGFNLYSDTVIVTEDALNDADKRATVVKIVRATIKGWVDALADPAAAAKLVVEKYGSTLNLDLKAQTLTAEAEVPLIQTAETEKNGLFVMTPEGIAENMKTMQAAGVEGTAEEIFDTSILAEIGPIGAGSSSATPAA